MAWWIALTLAAQPALPAPAAARDPVSRVRTSGRASVRIVRPYRLRVGDPRPAPGSSKRNTTIADPAGNRRPAVLVEFE